MVTLGVGGTWGVGGGYYSQGRMTATIATGFIQGNPVNVIGGQGGIAEVNGYIREDWYKTHGGDGGIAGKGGTIRVSQNAKVYAFNGNKYTDGQSGHEYNNGQNQLEIYAQNGVLRAVYKYNCHWGTETEKTYSYWQQILGNQINTLIKNETTPSDTYAKTEGKNLLVRAEQTGSKSGYMNPITNNSYGIGSGAGYVEVSNGTYTIDNSMN